MNKVLLSIASKFEAGGGTLCVLLALFCTSAVRSFRKNEQNKSEQSLSKLDWVKLWSSALELGTEAIQEFGRVKPGQRSVIDPLHALSEYAKQQMATFHESSLDLSVLLKAMVDVADRACRATSTMRPMVGRASYVDPSLVNTPDAGATAVTIVISSIYRSFLLYAQIKEFRRKGGSVNLDTKTF